MGIYGQTAKQILENQPIVITLEDTNDKNILYEAKVVLNNKGKEIDLLIRDSHLATRGSSIPKDKSVSKMNHAASVKLRTPKDIVGEEGLPIEIHDNKAEFNEEAYNNLKKKLPKNIEDCAKKFVNKNIVELNELWDNENTSKDIESWKKIIDRDYKIIKKITGVSKEVIQYLDDKKKGE